MTGPGTVLGRLHWRNWPVLVKLVAVLLVPTLVALIVGALRVLDQAGAVPGYLRTAQIAGTQQQLSELIGAVQQERDLATAFVATGRSGDRAPLGQQFDAVQARTAGVQTLADQVGELDSTGYRTVLDDLSELRPLRESVQTGTESVEVVVTEYGAAIDPLIALDATLVRKLDDVTVADDAAAAHALMVSREQVSRQHAIVAATLPTNRIKPPQLEEVRAAGVRLGGEQETFRTALESAQQDSYVSRAIGEAEESRQRLLQLVIERGDKNKPLDISPVEWNARTVAAIQDLVTVENDLRQRIDRTVLALRDDARAAAGWNAVILIFALVLGVVITVLIARSMLGPLGVLKRTALDIAGRRLPAAMARVREGEQPDQEIEPVAVRTDEEIGQVARAFDEVHRQAMRLAGEQARLRAHVNDIFVNLSRRSQSLVERQLQLIDRLESTEQDPEALDNLFQLDHLATRMRRNSDNLLVLAGTEATKRSGRPVRLVDVLRAAVSEVEQYQRVVLQQPPGVLVLGRAAGDLVHLLAELLDNATQFSSPDTQVVVSGELDPDGEVLIEVVDRGVGVPQPELVKINERLAGTPLVDASVSRRMGLFVVGRLAVRHGIAVRLRDGQDGLGVCAAVRIPARLVKPSSNDDAPSADNTDTTLGALPAGNGSVPDPAEPVAVRAAEPDPTPASPGHLNGKGGPLTNGDPVQPGEAPDQAEPPLPRRTGDLLPRRVSDRSAPAGQPPVPPAPSSPPLTIPAQSSPPLAGSAASSPPLAGPAASSAPSASPGAVPAGGLFQPGGTPAGSTARPAVTLQHSTPIFDDVATAWFREYQAIPVRWTTSDALEQPAVAEPNPVEVEAQPDRPATQPPAGPADEASQRTPGPDPVGPQPDPVAEPATAQPDDWGAGDEGWQAVQALTGSALSVGVTAAGLPRRRPQALLVPGAAGGPVLAEPSGTPARSAELIRGRLASYQQGLRDGRHARRNRDQHASGSHQQQDAEEEKQ